MENEMRNNQNIVYTPESVGLPYILLNFVLLIALAPILIILAFIYHSVKYLFRFKKKVQPVNILNMQMDIQ